MASGQTGTLSLLLGPNIWVSNIWKQILTCGIGSWYHAFSMHRYQTVEEEYNCDFFSRLTKHTYLVHFCGDTAFYRRNMLALFSSFWKDFFLFRMQHADIFISFWFLFFFGGFRSENPFNQDLTTFNKASTREFFSYTKTCPSILILIDLVEFKTSL